MKRTLTNGRFWTLTMIAAVLLPMTTTTGTAQAAVPYNLRVLHSGKCLDVRGPSQADGALVQQWECIRPKKANQLWIIEPTGDIYASYYIKPQHSRSKCLDIRGPSLEEGALAQQWTCTGGENQRWLLFSDDGWQTMEIVSLYSGLCLDVRAPANDDGALVQQWGCTGGFNQRFWQN